MPSGQTHEATSVEGSSSTRDKHTGALVPLLVIPEKPDEVQEARHYIFTAIGIALLAACAGLFYYAFTAFQMGPMTWVAGALVLVHFAQRIRRILLPREKRLQLFTGRQTLRQSGTAQLAAPPVQPLEDVTSSSELRFQGARRRIAQRRLAPWLLIAGLGLVAIGVQQSLALMRLESVGMRARGEVSSLSFSGQGSSSGAYYPEVTYMQSDGRQVRFRDTTGSKSPHVSRERLSDRAVFPRGIGRQ